MHIARKIVVLAVGAYLATCPTLAISQPAAPPDNPETSDRETQRAHEIQFIKRTSKQWQEKQVYGPLGKDDPSFEARRNAYAQLYKKLYEERDRYLAEFAKARDEKTKLKLIKEAYEIADALNEAIKPDTIKSDGTVGFGSRYEDWDPVREVERGLIILNEDMERELDGLFKLMNSNKQEETRAALDRIRRSISKLKDLDAKQAFVEKYLFGNAMFIGSTRYYTKQFKDRRERYEKLFDLYEDYEKAYDRKWPSETPPENKNDGTSATDMGVSSIQYPEQAEKFAWLLGTWHSYSPWGDQSQPTGGTLVFTIGADGTVEGRIGKLNDHQKELGYTVGMLVYRGFRDVRSYGAAGTTRFESFDGEFLQIQDDSIEWRSDSIGVRQNGILYQSPPAYSTLAGPFKKADVTM